MADTGMSPQMAHSIAARDERWRQAMEDYRFLTDKELGDPAAGRTLLSIIEHDGAALYPAFQFDEAGRVRPVIFELMDLAKSSGWSQRSLILWLVTPTGFYDDQAPIKYLDDPDMILAGARSRFEQSW